jgi:prolipoprotein diacylglyceryltransferase
LCRWHRAGRFERRRLFLFFSLYGAMRFFLEFLREPLAREIAGLGFYQWLALVVCLVGAFQVVKRSRVGYQAVPA